METLEEMAESRLKLLESRHLRREPVATARAGAQVTRGEKQLISFACNDYLGLSQHREVVEAGRRALAEHGAGAGASRLVSGNHPLNAELEALLAEIKHAPAACVFGSGYLANIGTIPALVGAGDLIVADRLVHACMLDGARLSGATLFRFAHNSVDHCRALLEDSRGEYARCLILTETVFSMDGDRAPVAQLAELAHEHDAWLMTDDAHGLGVVPHTHGAHVQMGTLSKAAGTYGGYVCASENVVGLLKTAARSLMFSTGLPPAVLASSLAALKIMRQDAQLCARPLQNARYFTQALGLPQAESAIVPLVLGEAERALAAATLLEEEGFYVAAIRPPAVPENGARLRFAFSALHTREQIGRLAEVLLTRGMVCAPSA